MMQGQGRRPLRGGNWFKNAWKDIKREAGSAFREVVKPAVKTAVRRGVGGLLGDGRRERRAPVRRARARPAVRARQVGMARAPAKRKRVVRRAGVRPMGGRGTVSYQASVGNIAY